MSIIKWRHNGRQILLPIALLRPGDPADITNIRLTALVDTGATTSGIGRSAIETLHLASHTKKLLKSAHGEDHVSYYIFRIGLFPDTNEAQSGAALPYVFPESEGFGFTPSSGYQAILGMDILKLCDFSIDRRGRCTLSLG